MPVPKEETFDPISNVDLDRLPVISPLATRLLGLSDDSPELMSELVYIIRSDPVITAKMIQLANSAAYRRGDPVGRVSDAVARIGVDQARSVSLSLSLFGSFLGCGCAEELWRHSFMAGIGVRMLCRAMPRHIRPSEDQAFLCGLLHDFGYLVLSYLNPERFEAFRDTLCQIDNEVAMQAERQYFGLTHTEVGAALAGRWGIPSETQDAIRWHHAPGMLGGAWQMSALVYAVDRVLSTTTRELEMSGPVYGLSAEFLDRLGLSEYDFSVLAQQLRAQADTLDIFIGSFSGA